jgi:hypothetical protein
MEEMRMLGMNPSSAGRSSISDLIADAYVTDLAPGKRLEVIRRQSRLQDSLIAQFTAAEGVMQCRGNL